MRSAKPNRPLRPGDTVEVRPAAEILATLDENASLEAVPFMPEMLKYVGRRFSVSRRVEKICDTAGGTYLSRRMRSTVLLEDLRCDGSGHGGCQAGCRLYWKEAWLQRVDRVAEPGEPDQTGMSELDSLTRASTTTSRELNGSAATTYRCQATEAPTASEPLGRYDLHQYVREVGSGNVGLLRVLWVLARAAGRKMRRVLRLRGVLPPPERDAVATPGVLGLRPGDVVQVRSREEIATTLDEHGKNRGLWFDDAEMIRHCGGTYRVHDRVERFIDDQTGKMIELSSDCVILEGVACSGELSPWRWFCPRGIYSFWREAWLRRVDGEDPPQTM